MAFTPEFSILAPIAAAVAYFFVGWLWYGPVFGKAWAKEMGMSMDEKVAPKKMLMSMGNNLVGNLLLAFVFTHVIAAFGAADVASAGGATTAQINGAIKTVSIGMALEGAAWSWLGFFLPLDAGRAAWEKASWKLVAINAAYHLVGLAVMAVVIVSLA